MWTPTPQGSTGTDRLTGDTFADTGAGRQRRHVPTSPVSEVAETQKTRPNHGRVTILDSARGTTRVPRARRDSLSGYVFIPPPLVTVGESGGAYSVSHGNLLVRGSGGIFEGGPGVCSHPGSVCWSPQTLCRLTVPPTRLLRSHYRMALLSLASRGNACQASSLTGPVLPNTLALSGL